MEKRDLQIGDVVQLNEDNEAFSFMFLVVTEHKTWGCQGYLLMDKNIEAHRYDGKAYFRPTWDRMEYVGKSAFIDQREEVANEV